MEHFGEDLLKQRSAREQSLAQLVEYQNALEGEVKVEEEPAKPDTQFAEAIRATFAEFGDLSDEDAAEDEDQIIEEPKETEEKAVVVNGRNRFPDLDETGGVSVVVWIIGVVAALAAAVALAYLYFSGPV